MTHTSKSFILSLLTAAACAPAPMGSSAAAPAAAAPAPVSPEINNVILMIGDGTGISYWSAAKFAVGELAVEEMPVVGLVDTRSSSSRVTDSAAGATVYATGVRTYNGAIGVGPACQDLVKRDSAAIARDPASCDPLETVLEVAERQGQATGLVATSTITHATPASFGAHVPNRSMQPEIAEQLAAAPIDVLLGGGRGFFSGATRPDSANLLEALCESAACLSTPAELAAYQPDDRRLVGLFAEGGMDPARTRTPGLPELTRVALEKLSRDPKGFFLMVEGSQPDWRGHENAPLSEAVDEVVDFDRTIATVLEFARTHPGTLVVVTADHETGGLALGEEDGSLVGAYTTDYHTAEMVPLFAFGPGAERFAGIQENYEVGRTLMELVSQMK
jgi:alkaline phosphatase